GGALGDYSLPLIPGHELTGRVVELGTGVVDGPLRLSDQVIPHIVVPCEDCWHCSNGMDYLCEAAERLGQERPGGFGRFVAIPAYRCAPTSGYLDPVAASIVTGAIGGPLHALRSECRLA